MDTNPRVLRREITRHLTDIERQIGQVYRRAEEMHTEAFLIRDEKGNFLLTPLLVAKAQCLHSLTLLQS